MTMSKRMENKLQKLVEQWLPKKEQATLLEKEVKELNTEIRAIMSVENLEKFQFEDTTLKLQKVEKVDFLEDELLSIVKKSDVEGLIKTKEYVDMDALESAIYHDKIDASVLKPAQLISYHYRLTTSKSKRKEG